MCGFVGEFTFSEGQITKKDIFKSILDLSKHRGPDYSEIVSDAGYQLGFNRLAILDTSPNGNQPKQSPRGRYHVVFNGEIYNYKDLAESYNLTNLKSNSDTEVLIHLLDVLGVEETINVLNGMFAIAIIDAEQDCLYLTRDFAGIKPLFYGISSEGVVMASQFNQVYTHPWFCKTLRLLPQMVKSYFGFGYMQSPNTIYDGIFQVNPGELVEISRNKSVSKTIITEFCKEQSYDYEAESNLSMTIKTAVAKQLVSDVPLATFLSGGVDSPLISAYAKKEIPSIEAFTLKVDNPKYNESDIAKSYAEHLDIKQHIVAVEESDLLSEIDNHFKAFSEPFGDFSSIPTYVISKEAKKKHTVMLSGDGGDELFFGYPRMLDVLQKRWWFKLPYIIRKPIAQITNKLGLTNTWAPYFKTLNDFIINKHLKIPADKLNSIVPKTSFSSQLKQLYKFNNNKNKLLHQLRFNEFYAHMQRVLIKVDRASMAHSLEVRVPFLYKSVITLAWKQKGQLQSKQDLKKDLKVLLANEVPESLINKKKMGFSVPLEDWLHQHLKQDVLDVVFEKPFYGDDIINVKAARGYINDFFDKKHNNAWGVWHIYAWQKWWIIHGTN